MPSNDLDSKGSREFKIYIYSSAEIISSMLPLVATLEPIISLPIFLYGVADGFTRMETERGVSERIYKSAVSIYRHLTKR